MVAWPTPFRLSGFSLSGPKDIVIADFEGETYGDWMVTGTAFGQGPARGTLPNQMTVTGFSGHGFATSYNGGDTSVGTLTSPAFTVTRKFIRFLLGGGRDLDRSVMNLIINGRTVRQATGGNDHPEGTEALEPHQWNVSEFAGKTARVEIVDRSTGGWGHINVDQIVMTDHKLKMTTSNASRTFYIDHRFLNIPIKNGGTSRKMRILIDGKLHSENDVELADGPADWWAAFEVTHWKSHKVEIQVDQLPGESLGLSSIAQSNSPRGNDPPYAEPLRGQFHFSPRRGWNNDPNGLVFYNNEYHMFFQHNPFGWGWGNMHWGHAVSKDLVHWEELPDALEPDKFGPMFSGSAVVDRQNTSGFGKPGHPPLVLLYTAAGDPTVQCLAYSTDGRTFTKFSANPVIPQVTSGNRDPKVIWDAVTKQWVMALYVELNGLHTIHFYRSANLTHWDLMSHIDGFFECPDLFELPVDGDKSIRKWVLTAASSEYVVGTFDGTRFTPETPKLPGHQGSGFYAAQTFSDIPVTDGRRIQIGWFQTETKGMPFNQSMSIPLELKLLQTMIGPRLSWNPVKELEALRVISHDFGPLLLDSNGPNTLASVHGELLEVRADFAPSASSVVEFSVRGVLIFFDTAKQELTVNGHTSPAPLMNGRQDLIIYCDRTGLEVFASHGLTYVPMPFIVNPQILSASVKVTGGTAEFKTLQVHDLKSAWTPH